MDALECDCKGKGNGVGRGVLLSGMLRVIDVKCNRWVCLCGAEVGVVVVPVVLFVLCSCVVPLFSVASIQSKKSKSKSNQIPSYLM